jgi:hypothetical protein
MSDQIDGDFEATIELDLGELVEWQIKNLHLFTDVELVRLCSLIRNEIADRDNMAERYPH